MIASDGEIPVFGRDAPHPRSYGTFARVLSEYVRNRRHPHGRAGGAQDGGAARARLTLGDRGRLEEGKKADLAVFDPAR